MTWFWYVARPNELFIDCDRYQESIGHIRKRLQGAIECGALSVYGVHDFKSSTPNHHHLIVVLNHMMRPMQRYAWEMLLHGDIYRAACNIMREEINETVKNAFIASDVLISKNKLHRIPDSVCFCETKHVRSVMEKCTVALQLRGIYRSAGYFGKPSNNPCEFLPE